MAMAMAAALRILGCIFFKPPKLVALYSQRGLPFGKNPLPKIQVLESIYPIPGLLWLLAHTAKERDPDLNRAPEICSPLIR